jgi:signal transduction histidine kinase
MRTSSGRRQCSKIRTAVRLAGLSLCVLLLPLLFAEIAVPAPEARRILLLHSEEHETAPFSVFEEAFRRHVGKHSPGGVDFYEVSLQSDEGGDQEALLSYALWRFRKQAPAIIVPIGGPAAKFAQKHRSRLFPSSPMLLSAVDHRHVANATLTGNDAVVAVKNDPAVAVENILRVLPETTNLFVVIGNSELDRFWRSVLERELEPFRSRLTIEWWNDLSFAEMLKRCAVLPARSAILYALMNTDAAGVAHTEAEALADLHSVANAPLFGVQSSQMGQGIVGGPLMSMEDLGHNTAEIALRILNGESPANIQAQVHTPGPPSYDWRELRRWKIDESRLPPGSLLNFREPTLWQRYKWHVVVTATVGIAGLLLIIALITNLVKRRRAEEVARSLGRQLLDAAESERARVARELHDDVSQRLARLAIEASGIPFEQNPAARDAITREVRDEIVRLGEDVHALAYKMHPALLQRLGLADSLRAECERFARQTSIDLSVNVEEIPAQIPHDTALCLVRVTQEALTNVSRHARSKTAEVSLRMASNGLELTVSDAGIGFNGKAPVRLGLASMQERVRLLKGKLTVDSRPDHGTRVRAWVPCEESDAK